MGYRHASWICNCFQSTSYVVAGGVGLERVDGLRDVLPLDHLPAGPLVHAGGAAALHAEVGPRDPLRPVDHEFAGALIPENLRAGIVLLVPCLREKTGKRGSWRSRWP